MTADDLLQIGYTVSFEWGWQGADALAPLADVTVVVDVLSFTTTLSVAADLGIAVVPHAGDPDEAVRVALDHGATLAGPRSLTAGPSLSPASLRRWARPGTLVLPSPNGSAISRRLAVRGTQVVGASLRNADAVAEAVSGVDRVLVVAAGEAWPDGSLRPAVEDLWGAGAVVAALGERGLSLSPEASAAAAAYREVRGREHRALLECASGRELTGRGLDADVGIAAEVGQSGSVPRLVDGAFVR
ncbi:2-phosphosulfolactate phosphatase [Cellulomonas sp. URHD0024]|uniref:2-phosphosulfolactate phosphatase n=1 Tax=Cellulomonas sp. URHD0024 TaxID=1302620 RepID=UPI00041418A3|nr:2-phosphosulfolactate phosphatase [Cellulomonas sp. URHD0024]